MTYLDTALKVMEELRRDGRDFPPSTSAESWTREVTTPTVAHKAHYAQEVPSDEVEVAFGVYPSNPAELLAYLRARGFPPVIDETVGSRLCIDAQSLPPPDLHLFLRYHKPALVALLRAENEFTRSLPGQNGRPDPGDRPTQDLPISPDPQREEGTMRRVRARLHTYGKFSKYGENVYKVGQHVDLLIANGWKLVRKNESYSYLRAPEGHVGKYAIVTLDIPTREATEAFVFRIHAKRVAWSGTFHGWKAAYRPAYTSISSFKILKVTAEGSESYPEVKESHLETELRIGEGKIGGSFFIWRNGDDQPPDVYFNDEEILEDEPSRGLPGS